MLFLQKKIEYPTTMENKTDCPISFDTIANRYDFLNRFLTFGLDTFWRRRLSKKIPATAKTLLDLATGTGDQIVSMLKRKKNIHKVFGLDISEEMLKRAYKKIASYPFYHKVTFLHCPCTDIPLDDSRIDCITLSFGMRNFARQQSALQEMYRLLKPKGKLLILEFFPPHKRIAPLFNFFMKKMYFISKNARNCQKNHF